jgi:hypothetical protein
MEAPRCVEEDCEHAAAAGDLRCELHRSRYGARPRQESRTVTPVTVALDAPSQRAAPAPPLLSKSRWRADVLATLGLCAIGWVTVIPASALESSDSRMTATVAGALATLVAVVIAASSLRTAQSVVQRLISLALLLLTVGNVGFNCSAQFSALSEDHRFSKMPLQGTTLGQPSRQ